MQTVATMGPGGGRIMAKQQMMQAHLQYPQLGTKVGADGATLCKIPIHTKIIHIVTALCIDKHAAHCVSSIRV